MVTATAIISCSPKKKNVLVPEVISLPQRILTTPDISIQSVFRNDSITVIDTNNVVVIIKKDTVKQTIRVKAICPEEKVTVQTKVVEKEVIRKKIRWDMVLVVSVIFAILLNYLLFKLK